MFKLEHGWFVCHVDLENFTIVENKAIKMILG